MITTIKKVMIFGTFDFFHAGHDFFIKEASKLGDQLIVVISRDRTTKLVKGEFPDNNEKTRLKIIKKHPLVTKAILGDLQDKYAAIKKYRPEVIALGYDQYIFTQQIKPIIIKNKISAEIIRLNPYKPEMYKSSILKKQKNAEEDITKVCNLD
ncbi:hypothetical protein A2483_01470 [Candidatus Peregrinibacteria bacterium RIFOXYC2_FULL_33_13]|nr:MAG: Cytidyltransferase-related domain protein [Candidatus Peregrinibacteria bacterium GW2011_GWA2_33_10]KKP38304.1 MAG: hypothetical protein UR30_C0021G0012 [Candidatus Peregrinibacteria bacterium GW2011_GWC2_33_13]OGJ46742.1 MAG: hypothetical protein A2229_01365 [Candidatus Peregrinibacteria bacterium RIFOXYA2_FULL_33_7]OGJ52827.1 MAG: hypothetical protein A2483_01470 [Candidatus Peregrinibacteria bacterium RIFOXYC2_FULL_33_13]